MTAPKIGTVMWPMQSWPEAGELWRRAEDLGFRHAWVYDHLAWRGTTPWYDAYTTLAAAAARVTLESPGAADRVSLLGDQHASAGYRAHLAEVLTRRALTKAIARGGRSS